jgi:hypothetical protein
MTVAASPRFRAAESARDGKVASVRGPYVVIMSVIDRIYGRIWRGPVLQRLPRFTR